jgi:hypothetical protein
MYRALSHGLSRDLHRTLVFTDDSTDIGTAAATLADATSSAAGTHIQPVTGTSAVTLDLLTSTATGRFGQTGTSAVTLDALTSTATGRFGQTGTAANTLDALTSVASGTASDAAIDFNFILDTLTAAGGPAVITFTRASTAMVYNSSGVLTSVAIDAPRFDHDRVTPWASRGLLVEEGRTNLNLWSEDFSNVAYSRVRSGLTTNAVAAPDGNTTADKLTEQTDVATNRSIGQNISVTSGSTYTISVFAKAAERSGINLRFASGFAAGNVTFDLSGSGSTTIGGTVANSGITPLNNGWYRCFASYVATSTTTAGAQIFITSGGSGITYDGVSGNGVYLWGMDVEVGGWATSYIPTTTLAVTRAVDVALVSTLSPWFNATEGTMYCEVTPVGVGTLQTYAYFDDTTSNERMGIRSSATSNAILAVDGGVTQVNSAIGNIAAGTTYKCAMGYKLNDFGGSQAGAAIVTDVSATLPTVTRFLIGSRQTGFDPANAWFKRVKVYNVKKSSAEIVALTA